MPFSRDSVGDHSAIANGIDILQIGAQLLVNQNFSLFQFHAAALQKRRVGADTHRHNCHLTGKEHTFGLYSCHTAAACEAESFGVGQHTNPFLCQMFFDISGHFRIKNLGKELTCGINNGYRYPLGL